MQSSNDSVISFSLKLARIFNQYETNEYIFPLFNHPNIAIRIEAIDLISHLGFWSNRIVKIDINERSNDEKIANFKNGRKMYTKNDVPLFLSS
jgi:hypothetical protein